MTAAGTCARLRPLRQSFAERPESRREKAAPTHLMRRPSKRAAVTARRGRERQREAAVVATARGVRLTDAREGRPGACGVWTRTGEP